MALFYQGICLQNKRKSNMDSLLLARQVLEEETLGLFVVCDGVGSSKYGGEVAEFLVEGLEDWFFSQKNLRYLGTKMTQEIFRLNQEILFWLKGESGQSTLSALLFTPKKIVFAHVGDSRIYEKDPKKGWIPLSCDHCNQQGKLLEYMGKKKNLSLDFWEIPRKNGEFLLCTDGFYRKQDWHLTYHALHKQPQEKIRPTLEELAQYVIAKGEKDNCSALYLQIYSEDSP